MHSLSNGIRGLGIVCLVLAVSASAFSQTTTGRILGTVSDQSGAGVAGASLAVTDVQRGTTRTVTSDASGDYVVPEPTSRAFTESGPKPRVSRASSAPISWSRLRRMCASTSRFPLDEVTETVVITEEVPLVDTTSSTLGGTLSNKEINDLPLNGRNYENLLQLRPGVVRYPGGGFSTTSANGLRAEDNAYLVDGLVQQRTVLRAEHHQRRRNRRRLGDDFARRCDPGIQSYSRILRPNMDGSRARS